MTRLLFLLLFLALGSWTWGVELLARPEVTVLEPGTVKVAWRTDVACGTRMSYGLSLEKLDQKLEGPVTASHEVILQGLKTGGTYYFTLGSARQKLYTGNFTVPEAAAKAPPPKASLLERMAGVFGYESRPAPAAASSEARPRAPPTAKTWGRLDTLTDHFQRHGADFAARNADDYAAQAWHFLQRARAGQLPMKWDAADATLRVFDPRTRAFAAYNRDGTTKTFFRPDSPSYWDRQPGRTVRPQDLPF